MIAKNSSIGHGVNMKSAAASMSRNVPWGIGGIILRLRGLVLQADIYADIKAAYFRGENQKNICYIVSYEEKICGHTSGHKTG